MVSRSMKWAAAAACLCGLLATDHASANNDNTEFTGNELRVYCNQPNADAQNVGWFMCIAMVTGLMEGYTTGVEVGYMAGVGHPLNAEQENRLRAYCAPANGTREQSALVVTKFLADHPERLSQPDVFLVLDAFQAAWPCPSK